LNGLQQKSVLALDTVSELEASLKERDTLPVDTMETNGHTSSSRSARPNGLGRLDKKQIEQRIEEDRERHKRLKESMWGVAGDRENAALKLFEEGSDCGDDDLLIAVEDELDTGKTTGPG
jgi:CTD kinase subunit gamma